MHVVVSYDIDTSGGTASIAVSLGGVLEVTYAWDGAQVIVAPRPNAVEFPLEDFEEALGQISTWMRIVVEQLNPGLAVTGSFERRLEKNKPAGALEIEAEVGGIPIAAEWKQSSGEVEIAARPGGSLSWTDFNLFIALHRELAAEANRF